MTLQFNFLAITMPSVPHQGFLAYLCAPARSAEHVAGPGQAGTGCPVPGWDTVAFSAGGWNTAAGPWPGSVG